jgi:hypothetical protein
MDIFLHIDTGEVFVNIMFWWYSWPSRLMMVRKDAVESPSLFILLKLHVF